VPSGPPRGRPLRPGRLIRRLAALAAGAAIAGGVLLGACQDDAAGPNGRRTAIVTKVTDGDTIRLSGLGRTRLIGIDTPEVFGEAECYGREASEFMKRLLPPGTRVSYRLGVEPRDRYGRALAYVWLADGRMVNLLLAERGYAQPLTIPPNVDYAERFVAAARRARRAARGLWGVPGCPDGG
jgi:micrococcal nuclease